MSMDEHDAKPQRRRNKTAAAFFFAIAVIFVGFVLIRPFARALVPKVVDSIRSDDPASWTWEPFDDSGFHIDLPAHWRPVPQTELSAGMDSLGSTLKQQTVFPRMLCTLTLPAKDRVFVATVQPSDIEMAELTSGYVLQRSVLPKFELQAEEHRQINGRWFLVLEVEYTPRSEGGKRMVGLIANTITTDRKRYRLGLMGLTGHRDDLRTQFDAILNRCEIR